MSDAIPTNGCGCTEDGRADQRGRRGCIEISQGTTFDGKSNISRRLFSTTARCLPAGYSATRPLRGRLATKSCCDVRVSKTINFPWVGQGLPKLLQTVDFFSANIVALEPSVVFPANAG